jgi:hypothetical protein
MGANLFDFFAACQQFCVIGAVGEENVEVCENFVSITNRVSWVVKPLCLCVDVCML